MVVFCYAAKVCKMIKISKMDVLKIRVLLTASPLRGSMRGRAAPCPNLRKRLVGVTHRPAPAELIHGRHDTSCPYFAWSVLLTDSLLWEPRLT